MEKTLYFATGNENKFREVREILHDYDVEQLKVDLPELQGDMEEVARKKAELAYQNIRKPVFVDDTALSFNALGGMPGIYIKHFLKAMGNERLPRLLDGFKDKSASAFASIGYCDGKTTEVFIGECKGKIVERREGNHGFKFGWDPLFQPDGYEKTFAELEPEIKNRISHRKKALEKFKEFLNEK
jgi:inosine triphosphate pyrophosphatase